MKVDFAVAPAVQFKSKFIETGELEKLIDAKMDEKLQKAFAKQRDKAKASATLNSEQSNSEIACESDSFATESFFDGGSESSTLSPSNRFGNTYSFHLRQTASINRLRAMDGTRNDQERQ